MSGSADRKSINPPGSFCYSPAEEGDCTHQHQENRGWVFAELIRGRAGGQWAAEEDSVFDNDVFAQLHLQLQQREGDSDFSSGTGGLVVQWC